MNILNTIDRLRRHLKQLNHYWNSHLDQNLSSIDLIKIYVVVVATVDRVAVVELKQRPLDQIDLMNLRNDLEVDDVNANGYGVVNDVNLLKEKRPVLWQHLVVADHHVVVAYRLIKQQLIGHGDGDVKALVDHCVNCDDATVVATNDDYDGHDDGDHDGDHFVACQQLQLRQRQQPIRQQLYCY